MSKILFLSACLMMFPLAGFTQLPSPVTKIMIDPTAGMGGTVTDLYDEVNYIPLETTKESLFGEIDQLVVTDQYFIILDMTTEAILFFNKDGSFHHKIAKFHFDKMSVLPKRPNIVNNTVRSFSVDAIKQQLFIPSYFERDSLCIFSFEGKPLGKLPLPHQTWDYFLLKNGAAFYHQGRPYSISEAGPYQPYDISFFKSPATAPIHLFPVNFKYAALGNDMSIHPHYFTYAENADECFYTPDLDYNVYELDSTGIRRQYQFLFPLQYSLPPNFGYDSIYTNKRNAYLKDKNLINAIGGFNKIGNYLLLEFKGPFIISTNTYLYNLKTTQLILLNRISPDNKSYYLPVRPGDSNPWASILACDKNSFFISFPSLRMFAAKEDSEEEHPVYSPVLENYFKTQNRKSNPVIVQLKLKNNL